MGTNLLFRSCLAACLVSALVWAAAPSCGYAEEGAAAAEEGAEPAAEGAAGAEGEGEKEKEPLPVAPDYMPLPMLNIPVLKKNRLQGNLMITMVLDVATDETMQAIDVNRTRLNAGYTETLSVWATKFQSPRAPANVIAIKHQLQTVTDTVLGRNDAIVLLQGAMLRR